jgi:hypothetical protein
MADMPKEKPEGKLVRDRKFVVCMRKEQLR